MEHCLQLNAVGRVSYSHDGSETGNTGAGKGSGTYLGSNVGSTN